MIELASDAAASPPALARLVCRQLPFIAHARGVAAGELRAVQFHFALRDVNPRVPSRRERLGNFLSGVQLRERQVRVLMDRD
jgi:hypothetical protein